MRHTAYVEFVAPPAPNSFLALVQLDTELKPVRVRRNAKRVPWKCDACGLRPLDDPCHHATVALQGQRQYFTHNKEGVTRP